LSFLLLGATGRTGLPFLEYSLGRGHRVTAYVRNRSKVPPALLANANLNVIEGKNEDQGKLEEAVFSAKPDVVYTMLASDPKPHNGISTGTLGTINALRSWRRKMNEGEGGTEASSSSSSLFPIPFITILAWGVGPTRPLIQHWLDRTLLSLILWFRIYERPAADMQVALAELEKAKEEKLVQYIVLAPPLLTNGPRTNSYLADGMKQMADKMRITDTISRADLAYEALLLGEKTAKRDAEGRAVSEFIGIKNP